MSSGQSGSQGTDSTECNEDIELIVKDGKLSLKPKTLEISMDDFHTLQKGLKLLKEKYPEISKECFPE